MAVANRLFRFQSASVYIGSKKIAICSGGSIKIAAGSEAVFIDGGYGGHTSGAKMSTIDVKTVNPVTNETEAVQSAMDGNEYVKFRAALINGKWLEVVGRVTGEDYSWDNKTGKVDGSFQIEGGGPSRT